MGSTPHTTGAIGVATEGLAPLSPVNQPHAYNQMRGGGGDDVRPARGMPVELARHSSPHSATRSPGNRSVESAALGGPMST